MTAKTKNDVYLGIAVRAATLRRQLKPDQLAIMAAEYREMLSSAAKQDRGRKGGKASRKSQDGEARAAESLVPPASTKSKRTHEQAAEVFNVSHSKTRKAIDLLKEDPVLAEQVKSGALSLSSAVSMASKEATRAAVAEAGKTLTLPDAVQVITGDFREVLPATVADESADLFFTDPPYDEASLPLWEALADLAYRKLKPGGFLLAYSGSAYLPRVMEILGRKLNFFWVVAVDHQRSPSKIWDRKVMACWKPILIYSKGPAKPQRFLMSDVLRVDSKDAKGLHPWAQPIEEAMKLVPIFCPPGGLLVDAMAGSGSIPAAGVAAGCRVVAVEIDGERCAVARKRVADALASDSKVEPCEPNESGPITVREAPVAIESVGHDTSSPGAAKEVPADAGAETPSPTTEPRAPSAKRMKSKKLQPDGEKIEPLDEVTI